MFNIKIAGFVICIDNKYDYIEKQCIKYITKETKIDFLASCTREEMEEERAKSEEIYSDGYIESICIYRRICLYIPKKGAFILHSAIIDVDGKAYAFLAKSGVGKSTHIRLWKQYLGDKVTIVNGDKPIIRLENGKFYAYGTPWSGKENWDSNVKSELRSLCFLERSKENRIEKVDEKQALVKITKQILMPADREDLISTLDLVDKLLQKCNLFILGCNISVDAAVLAYREMSKEIS